MAIGFEERPRPGAPIHPTKLLLLETGLSMLLERGYNDLGINALLGAAGVPKGSFYHHFDSKQDFALQVVDLYMEGVHQGLEITLADDGRPAVTRARAFFEATIQKYSEDGYLGCMLGGLGQELSGVNEVFGVRIQGCLDDISAQLAACLAQGKARGELPEDAEPEVMARLLVDCWEGAALRSRLQRDPGPLQRMLDFYFGAALGC